MILDKLYRHKKEVFVFILIVIVSVFLRFYQLDEYMTFLGDEGRDGLVVKRILVDGDYPLLGPPTSVGNMYLGPLYYYMMSVPMGIFWLEPVAAAGMVALIGSLTVVLVYLLARSWFGFFPAVLAALTYSISPVNIIYSKSSWNPNPEPFFATLIILGLYKIHKTKDFRWFILVGGALAFAIQMHYLALLLLPTILVFYLYEAFRKIPKKSLFLGTSLGILSFIFLMLPLVIFDFKYNFLNFRSLINILSGKETPLDKELASPIMRFLPIYIDTLIGRYISQGINLITWGISLIIAIPIVFNFYNFFKFRKINYPITLLSVWIILGLVGLSLYRQAVYDHYLGFLNPAPYFLLGAFVFLLKKPFKFPITALILLIIGYISFTNSPLLTPPNNQYLRTKVISEYILKKSEGKAFNFALIAERNYDSAYQFYLYKLGNPPKHLSESNTGQLFVVCEDRICGPINHPKYEISAFGYAKVESEGAVNGVRVFKLVPNPGGNPN